MKPFLTQKNMSAYGIAVLVLLLCGVFNILPAHAAVIDASPKVTSTSCSLGLSCGLVGYWTFDGRNVVNGVALDSSGNGNAGNLVSIATSTFYVPGKIGQAFNFDGANTYVNVPSSASLGTPGTNDRVTVSAWIKVSSNTGLYREIVISSGSIHWFLVLNTANSLCFSSSNAAGEYGCTNPYAADNHWHFVGATFDGTTIRIYKDGALQTSYSGATMPTGSTGVDIGSVAGGAQYFLGPIDDVRVYNRALSAAEIVQLYNTASTAFARSPKVTSTSCSFGLSCGLLVDWTFDGKTIVNGAFTDSVGSANKGSLVGAIASSTFYVPGKIGQAINLPGANQYIDVPFNSALNPTTAISVSAWFKTTTAASSKSLLGRITGTGNFPGYMLTMAPNYSCGTAGQIGFWVGDNTSRYVCTTTKYNDGKWHQAIGTYNGTTVSVYVDGVFQTSAVRTNGLNNTTADAWIGNDQTTGDYWPGSLDDVRIYNRALSATEVTQLYNTASTTFARSPKVTNSSCSSGLSCGLVGYWTFDGKMINWSTGVATDSSANGNSGQFSGMSTTTSPIPGKIGQALRFNGVNSVVTAKNSLGTVQSLSFWAKPNSLTQKLVDLNGTASLELIAGTVTANNFTSPTVYVDGALSSTVADTNWHYITVTTGTGISATALKMGVIASTFFGGSLDDVRFYSRALSATEVRQLYNTGR